MKKRLFALLVAMLMLVSIFSLASCDFLSFIPGLGDPCADGHVDADGDEICDNCETSVPKTEPGPVVPEEPEREPTYKITFNYHAVVYENKVEEEGENKGAPVLDDTGRPVRVGREQDVLIYTLDVLQNQAPTEDQLKEIPTITYSGITVLGWYDTPEFETEVDFTQVLTADKNVYAKLRIDEPDKKDNNYCGDNATWKLTSKGVLKIEGKGAMYDFTYPELAPWYFDAEGNRTVITGIEVGKNITHIGSYSFYNLGISNVKDIEIGEGVTSIGSYAFAYSTLLKEAPLTETIEFIGYGAFEGCKKFTSIIIPDSVVTIDGYAFAQCSDFEYIILGTGVKHIGEYAFNQTAKNSVSATHKNTFYRGTEEQYNTVVVQLGNPNFNSYGSKLYYYVEPDSAEAKTAGQYWTYDDKGNPKPLSYTIRYYVDGNAFPLLTDFVLIDADKTGVYTQANIDAMKAITYRGYKFETWSNPDISRYVSGELKVTQDIDFKAVRGNVIGDSMTYEYNPSAYTLTLKGSGSTWDFEGAGDTVYYAQYITRIVFDPEVTRLGANVLSGITSLVTVEIPETITSVDPRAFAGCTGLAAVYYMGTDITKCEGLSELVDTNANVYAKGSAEAIGKNGAYWQDTEDGVRLAWSYNDGVLTIGGADVMPDFEKGQAPWLGFTEAKELVFASNIKQIGAYAFNGMKGVDKITLHNKLTVIPRNAFEGSDYWNNSANWNNGALMAGAHLLAFDASKMTTPYATIPQETKIIVADAFTGCGTITELVLPVVIDSIDATAFDGLTGLQTIYYYGQNVNAWNKLPADARADLASAKVLYRSTTAPKCPDCAGKGVVSCGVCGETVNAECTECKGEGTVSCTTCGGSGAHHDVAGFWHMVSKVPTVWSN